MKDSDLQAVVDSYTWFHSMQFRPNVASSGPKSQAVLVDEAEAFFGPLALHGHSVLDVGAWNGFFSFESKRRGAGRVLATDSYTWNHPLYRGRGALELARSALGLDVETREVAPHELGKHLGLFDVTLFLGVFYHLINPIPVLFSLREVTHRLLILETHQDALNTIHPMMAFYPGATLNGDGTNWWGPNPTLMYHLLTEAGFERVPYRDHPICSATSLYPHRRGVYHAFTSADTSRLEKPGGYGNWLDLSIEANRSSLVTQV